jgi:serine/threonine-protein kinase RsbT
MNVQRNELIEIRASSDLVRVRQQVREWTVEAGFSLVDQTKMVTAASELARNTLVHGGSGVARVETVQRDGRPGVKAVFTDDGPGIVDVEKALTDGYTTGSGLGLGLGGSRRLVDEFVLETAVGLGTTVSVIKWMR